MEFLNAEALAEMTQFVMKYMHQGCEIRYNVAR